MKKKSIKSKKPKAKKPKKARVIRTDGVSYPTDDPPPSGNGQAHNN